MFAVVRNDDGYPVVLGIFFNEDDANAARDTEGSGHFVWKIDPNNIMKSIWT